MPEPLPQQTPVLEVDIAALRAALEPMMFCARQQEEAGAAAPIVLGVVPGALTITTGDHALRVTLRNIKTPDPTWHGRAVEIPRVELTKVLRGLPGTVAAPPKGAARTVRFFAEADAWRAEVTDEHAVSPALARAFAVCADGTTGVIPLALAWAIHAQALGIQGCDDDDGLCRVLEFANSQVTHRDVDVFRPMLRDWVEASNWWGAAESPEHMQALRDAARARIEKPEWNRDEWDRACVLEVLRRGPIATFPIALADRAILSTVCRLTTGDDLGVPLLPSETKRALALDTDAILRDIAAFVRDQSWSRDALAQAVDAPGAADRAACDLLIAGKVREIDAAIATRISGLPTTVLQAALLVHSPERRAETLMLGTADDAAVAETLARDWPDERRLPVDVLSRIERALEQRHHVRTADDRLASLQRQGEERRQVKRLRGREDQPTAFLAREDGTSPLAVGPPPVRRAVVLPTDPPVPVETCLSSDSAQAVLPPGQFLASANELGATLLVEFKSARWAIVSPHAVALYAPDNFGPANVEAAQAWASKEKLNIEYAWYRLSAAEAMALRAMWGQRLQAFAGNKGGLAHAWCRMDGDCTIVQVAGDAEMILGPERAREAAALLLSPVGDQLMAIAKTAGQWNASAAIPMTAATTASITQLQHDSRAPTDASELRDGLRVDPDPTTLSVTDAQGPGPSQYVGLGRERRKDPDSHVLVGQHSASAPPSAIALVDPDVFATGFHLASYLPQGVQAVRVHASTEANAPVLTHRHPVTVLLSHPDTVSAPHILPSEQVTMRSLGLRTPVPHHVPLQESDGYRMTRTLPLDDTTSSPVVEQAAVANG
jgi:hypothetical protein